MTAQADYLPPENDPELVPFERSEYKSILQGRFSPSDHSAFVCIDTAHCNRDMYMLEEAYEAFVAMAEAALKDSIRLSIVSATRNFDYQRMIWEDKWSGKTKVEGRKLPEWIHDAVGRALKILEYTAPPGFTRHHWGTDIDINSVEPEYFETEEGKKVYEWLKAHAPEFGFCQTYPALDENRPEGFSEEKWHWSYAPIADELWREQVRSFSEKDISGFKGCQAVRKIDLLNKYLLSIQRCSGD